MDALLTMKALNSLSIPITISHVENGALALLELIKETPDIVFCDLSLPKLSGKEVLRHFRNIARFDDVPFLILSSADSSEIEECMKAGSNGFIKKPLDSNEYLHKVQVVAEFFFTERANLDKLPDSMSQNP